MLCSGSRSGTERVCSRVGLERAQVVDLVQCGKRDTDGEETEKNHGPDIDQWQPGVCMECGSRHCFFSDRPKACSCLVVFTKNRLDRVLKPSRNLLARISCTSTRVYSVWVKHHFPGLKQAWLPWLRG